MNMKTIVYKNRLGRYDLIKIKNGSSKKIKLILEEPLNGKITFGNSVFKLSEGVAEIDTGKLCEGKNTPMLYSGGKIRLLEGFIYDGEEISYCLPSPEYVRNLSDSLFYLSERLSSAEEKIKGFEKKISERINF